MVQCNVANHKRASRWTKINSFSINRPLRRGYRRFCAFSDFLIKQAIPHMQRVIQDKVVHIVCISKLQINARDRASLRQDG